MIQNSNEKKSLYFFQNYVKNMEEERGFSSENATQKAFLLVEEVGELFKAIRKNDKNMKIDKNSKVGSIEEELADIFIYICAISNRFDINLENAFFKKEVYNKTRTWE